MTGLSEPVGLDIPNYRLIKRVGEGAFGQVWLAEEILTRIYRAIKIIPADSVKKQRIELEGVRQYQQRSHGHPHLVQVLTVGETADAFYYVMEAADNDLGTHLASPEDSEPRTLAAVLTREAPLPMDRALDHLESMLAGIDHLHSNGLHHRDLKPSNVLFVDGALKLADIGLASTDRTTSVGTPGYLTPDGKPDDLYAAGVMLYQMCTGQSASRFPELPADFGAAKDRRPRRKVLRLIDKACHPDGSQRFESPGQFLDGVRRIVDADRIGARRRAWGGAMVLLALLIALLAWTLGTRRGTLEWSDLKFVPNMDLAEETSFPAEEHERPSSFQVTAGSLFNNALQLTGSFDAFYSQENTDSIIGIMLAVDDRIVNVIYWDKPGEDGRQLAFHERQFPLRREVLENFSPDDPCIVYVVYAASADFFTLCDEYNRRAPKNTWADRLEIGRIHLQE
ncbi:MAG: serine/threonine protein kinase [Planctomycetes bacterium]|nr:serine/threonine protein kinase [Planctomycetota bacterium]